LIIGGCEDTILVGHLNSITLDSSGAGEGHVTCKVTNSIGEFIDVDIAEDDDNQVIIQYSVPTIDNYHVVIGFGGEVITGGDFTQQVSLWWCAFNNFIKLICITVHFNERLFSYIVQCSCVIDNANVIIKQVGI